MPVTYKRLGDIATYINGYAFKPEDWGISGLPIIRIQNLTGSSSEVNYYDGEIDEKYIVRNGDILIAWSASLGVHEWNGEDGYLNQHIFKVVFDKEEINKDFFKFMVQKVLERTLQYLHGSTMKHITKKYFDNLLIPFPPIDVQEKIAKILVLAESLVNKRKAQIEALDQLTQSVFFEMFGDISSNPKNWPLKRLGDFIKITGGFAFKSNEFVDTGIPVIKIGTVNKGYFDLETLSYVSKVTDKYQKYLIYPGDLLITLTGTVGKDDYGNVCIVPNKYNSYLLNQRVAKIEPLNNLDVIYLLYCFKQPTLKREITKLSRGIRQANISNEDINNLVIPLPPIEKQKKFSVIEQKIQLRKNSLIKSLQELENNFNSLMQRAFKGELFNEEKISIS
jgi:type I restriction enzyme, S subunit